jgi:hypothetical protein
MMATAGVAAAGLAGYAIGQNQSHGHPCSGYGGGYYGDSAYHGYRGPYGR